MSYENFITKLFNVNPSDLLKVTDTERKDGNIILRIRLVAKYNLCPICRTPGKIHAYYKRELKHSTFSNRPCVICYEQEGTFARNVLQHLVSPTLLLTQAKELLMRQRLLY